MEAISRKAFKKDQGEKCLNHNLHSIIPIIVQTIKVKVREPRTEAWEAISRKAGKKGQDAKCLIIVLIQLYLSSFIREKVS